MNKQIVGITLVAIVVAVAIGIAIGMVNAPVSDECVAAIDELNNSVQELAQASMDAVSLMGESTFVIIALAPSVIESIDDAVATYDGAIEQAAECGVEIDKSRNSGTRV